MATMNTDEEQIRHVIDTWHRATSAGDVDSVMPLMTEDVVFLTPGNLPVHGRAAFEQGLKNLLKSHSIESRAEVLEMQVDGALAYCWTNLTVTINPSASGEGLTRSGPTLTVFRKQTNGEWLLYRDANLLPPRK
jgi:uncharacterized protein (TIGR02246 family)